MAGANSRTFDKMTPEERFALQQKGGRAKKGVKHASTIDREAILEQIKNTVALRAKTLINVQTMLATGLIKVYKVHSYRQGKKWVRGKPKIVTDDEEIINALDWKFGDGPDPSDDVDFYFVATKDPHYKALDSLLDRTFGKAKESKEINHTGLNLGSLHEKAAAAASEEA